MRPAIDSVEQRVCLGRPLPMTHIDEVVPAPDGRLALVGRRTAELPDGAGIETVGWVVAVLDPAVPDDIEVIERTDATDRPTPIAWQDDTLLITVDGERLVPADDLGAEGLSPPFGVPAVFDAETPHLRVGADRAFMIVGEPSPRGDVLRTFVEVERGDPAAGTVDRVVATYGTLLNEAFSFGLDEETVGRFVEAVGITDWHIGPDGTLIAMGWAQSFIGRLDFWFLGKRRGVVSDREAGWFDAGALTTGEEWVYSDQLFGRVSYDLRGDAEGEPELVFYDPRGGPSTTPFNTIGVPAGRTVYDHPPPFADRVMVTTVALVGDDRLLAGSACVDPPYDETLFEQPRCRAFVSRYVGTTSETRWTVTVDVGDIDHVLDVRPVDGRLLVLAARYDIPHGRGSGLTPARLVMLDRAGHCLDE